ncbi:HutD family protein [Variovorax sp. J22G21]|uniref:HutD/Ves family protein n=1 Tax=Variovorax fucosicus TaxID=3053517 RepID=UPI002576594D|nr:MULTISPECIES: HutD family protein [unclassified Variovorax]MDM0039100.1 HutD family protein [Variovorax sp. J22R193]MDM0063876.1 HutD family protein [Variovorax sp. J22G21]
MSIQRFTFNELPVMRWKNGGGATREAVNWPPGAGLDAFDWRVSIANIAASGPFSVFAGVDRQIMLLEGDGVRLKSDDFDHRMAAPLEPFVFRGDAAVECTLLGGPSVDFNVMGRRARGTAELRIIAEAATLPRVSHGLLMSVDGQWRMGGSNLAQGQGVWWADQVEEWHVKPASRSARLAMVAWWPIQGEIPST